MLKKKQRLSRSDFSQLLRKGKRFHDTYLTLVSLVSTSTKCGLVVSKKTAKKAVERNLLRRRVYSVLGDNLSKIENRHIAVLTKKNITDLSFPELEKELLHALDELK